jgi:hypothetical protein
MRQRRRPGSGTAGVEANLAEWRLGALSVARQRAVAARARARRSVRSRPSTASEPTNVPARSLKLQADYRVAQVPGLALLGGLLSAREATAWCCPTTASRPPAGRARWTWALRYAHGEWLDAHCGLALPASTT